MTAANVNYVMMPSVALHLQVGPQARAFRREGEKSSKASSATKGDDQKRKTEYLVKVHFDGFTAKWDESYGEHEWREKKLLPLYTKVFRQYAGNCFHGHHAVPREERRLPARLILGRVSKTRGGLAG